MTILASSALAEIGVLDAGIVALLGYAVVFFGLILLMGVVIAMGRVFIALDRRAVAKATAKLSAMPAPAPVEEGNSSLWIYIVAGVVIVVAAVVIVVALKKKK